MTLNQVIKFLKRKSEKSFFGMVAEICKSNLNIIEHAIDSNYNIKCVDSDVVITDLNNEVFTIQLGGLKEFIEKEED